MSAPGWHPDPAGTGRQRFFDGNEWTSQYADQSAPPPPAPKKRKLWPWALGILVVIVVVAAISGNDDKKSPTASSSSSSSAAPQQTAAPAAAIGTPVSDGKFQFTVTSVDRSKTAGDPTNEFLQETAQGEFVNVHITVMNTGDQAQTYFATNQKLIIGGKKFDAASILGLKGDNANINPGLAVDTIVSFDVPPGTAPDAVELHDSAFSGGTTVSL